MKGFLILLVALIFSVGNAYAVEGLTTLDLTGCKIGEQAVSLWLGKSFSMQSKKIQHDDNKNYIKATIKGFGFLTENSKQSKFCKVEIYTYIEGADTAFTCSFPKSNKVFSFPTIQTSKQAWLLFGEDSKYCQYVH